MALPQPKAAKKVAPQLFNPTAPNPQAQTQNPNALAATILNKSVPTVNNQVPANTAAVPTTSGQGPYTPNAQIATPYSGGNQPSTGQYPTNQPPNPNLLPGQSSDLSFDKNYIPKSEAEATNPALDKYTSQQ